MTASDLKYIFDFLLNLFGIFTGLIKGEDISENVAALFDFSKKEEE